MIRKLGSDPNELFTFDNLQSEFRKCGAFAMSFIPLILQLKIATQSHLANLDEFSERIDENEDADIVLGYDNDTLVVYTDLINDLLTDLVDYGYID